MSPDPYGGFAELAAHAHRGVDYDVLARTRGRDPAIVVAAPHGGGIEPGTSELAAAIAGDEHALYAFEGLRPDDNAALHVTSARFDEPTALALVTAAETAVTVHGCRGRCDHVYVGGLNTALGAGVRSALATAGFPVADPPPGLQGRSPANLTNRARRWGVQLELSWPLRQRLLGGCRRTPALGPAGRVFVDAVRRALAAWRADVDGHHGDDAGRARPRPAGAQPVSGSSCSASELMQ